MNLLSGLFLMIVVAFLHVNDRFYTQALIQPYAKPVVDENEKFRVGVVSAENRIPEGVEEIQGTVWILSDTVLVTTAHSVENQTNVFLYNILHEGNDAVIDANEDCIDIMPGFHFETLNQDLSNDFAKIYLAEPLKDFKKTYDLVVADRSHQFIFPSKKVTLYAYGSKSSSGHPILTKAEVAYEHGDHCKNEYYPDGPYNNENFHPKSMMCLKHVNGSTGRFVQPGDSGGIVVETIENRGTKPSVHTIVSMIVAEGFKGGDVILPFTEKVHDFLYAAPVAKGRAVVRKMNLEDKWTPQLILKRKEMARRQHG